MEKDENLIEDSENSEEVEVYTLVDEDGVESQFEVIGKHEMDGTLYFAMIPMEEESDEYVILKLSKDDAGEECLVSVDDDDEFEKIADIFDDTLFDEIDYDEE